MSARSEAARATAIRNRRIEAVALGLLALLPVVPHLTFLLQTGVPRYALIGDYALMEQAARHVWSGDTLVGPPGRSAWHHPGPLFLYLTAPFTRLFGSSSTGLYLGTSVVNAASAGAIVGCARIFARRSHAVAALLVVLAWFVAFGNITANPWSPTIVVLPLMAFLVNAAMLARGKSAALYVAVLFGTLAAQTYAPASAVVIMAGTCALVAFVVGARRRGGLERVERWRIAIAFAMLFALFVPALVEQAISPTGNLTKIYRAVFNSAPLNPFTVATMDWTTATSWLPERLLHRTLVDENFVPLMVRADAMTSAVSAPARIIAIVHVAAVTTAAVIAVRRRDIVSVALLALGLLSDGVGVAVLGMTPGPSGYYLVFWTTAASSIAWMGVLSTVFSVIGAIAPRIPRISGVIAPALVVLGLSTAVTATSLQRFWIARHATAPSTRPDLRKDLRVIISGIEERSKRDGTIPVVHRDGAKDIADGIVLELEKNGADVRVANADRDALAGVRTANGVTKPLHLWFATTQRPLKTARCAASTDSKNRSLELIAKSGDIALYGSALESPSCPEAK
jgi:hypothetical protein